ncbi:MAG: hypothetical protein ACRDOE_22885, partial [Streptosporangiaceae bacterium]
ALPVACWISRPKSGSRFAIGSKAAAGVPARICAALMSRPGLPSHGHQLSRHDREARDVQYRAPAVGLAHLP